MAMSFFHLKKRLKELPLKEIWLSFKKIILASIIMSAVIYLIMLGASKWVNVLSAKGVLIQTILAVVSGTLTYFIVAKVLKMPELKSFIHIFTARFKRAPMPLE